ncbi:MULTISPECIES: hypothetical protein [unclassified Mesorhizobium]|uniref:hypothetical protein n=1 Tax=unclassified Mesorhizobium TaxID=325217 RepID=UPI002416CBC7|nr:MULTISPECIES: hypothetical protein [unclassified Mesorhizobium]MDG4903527.1 hypothetical protein [Mesorhizobium sp. WSM4962]MDG4921423.1 hypothetical protein [Mesorhizobium sp. WSM4989]
MAEKLTLVDSTMLPDHTLLRADDEVYFWREYTSGRDYSFGPGNDLISNLKKKPSTSNFYELKHKQRVIGECANFFAKAINPVWVDGAVFVPVPGSKAVGHPDYDNRMERVFRAVRPSKPPDVRNLLVQGVSTDAAHEAGGGHRPTPEELQANYQFDETISANVPKMIGIVDDVLTAGSHYRAVHGLLRHRFPDAWIVGFFVARRVFPPEPDFGAIDL